MIIPHRDESRKRKKKNLTKKLSILNAYINFRPTKVSNSRAGYKEGIEKVAKTMLSKGIGIEMISEITKLTKVEIDNLK